MLRYFNAFFVALCLEIGLTGAASGARSIVGAYGCVTYDAGKVQDRFQSVNTLWGGWLKVDTTEVGSGEPSRQGQVFVGFDQTAKRWSIIGVDSSGAYWIRHSTSRDFDGSRWSDTDPDDGGRAFIRVLKSGTQYTFDFTSLKRGGGSDASHTVCSRRSHLF